ncbi:hypothetical protein C0J52_07681, partial [Blattella germanica]
SSTGYWVVLENPPYIPDLGTSNYHFFKHIKKLFAQSALVICSMATVASILITLMLSKRVVQFTFNKSDIPVNILLLSYEKMAGSKPSTTSSQSGRSFEVFRSQARKIVFRIYNFSNETETTKFLMR